MRHPEFISGSDPSAQEARCRNKSGMTCWIAFTLAEVLITLGIIGVVASLTMPGLINDYQNKAYETAAMVFETRLEQALQQMNIAEDLTGLGSTKAFLDKLKEYMKIINTCEAGKLEPCFSDKINDWKTAELEFMGTKTWGTSVEAFVLQNGTTALIKYNKNCTSPGMAAKGSELRNCIAITYDTNGLKKPNQVGKDVGGDANFLIVLSGGTKMTSGDVQFTPEGGNYWLGAQIACENLGMRLPNSGSNTSATSCPDTDVFVFQGVSWPEPSSESEGCKIGAWCQANACTAKGYWLADAYSTRYQVVDGWQSIYHMGTAPGTTAGYSVRCVE